MGLIRWVGDVLAERFANMGEAMERCEGGETPLMGGSEAEAAMAEELAGEARREAADRGFCLCCSSGCDSSYPVMSIKVWRARASEYAMLGEVDDAEAEKSS